MAAPAFIGAVTGSAGNVDDLVLDITGIGHVAGDLAIAMVAFGDVLGSDGLPAGWFRVTDAVIAEDVELQGELLYRFLTADDDTFTFTGAGTGAIAAAITVYGGVDTLVTIDVEAETADTVGATSRIAPDVTTTIDDVRLVSAFFLWYGHTGITPDAGQTERVDVSVTATGGGTDRDVGIGLGDEAFTPAGATGTRTATTVESGLGNQIMIALSPADEERTAFDRELGSAQGRIDPVAYTNPDGTFVFCLGRDIAGQFHDLAAGDFVEVKQTADFDNVVIARVTVNMVGIDPGTAPAGLRWKFRLLIDSVERASAFIAEGETIEREFAANVEQLTPGTFHELALRLELVVP